MKREVAGEGHGHPPRPISPAGRGAMRGIPAVLTGLQKTVGNRATTTALAASHSMRLLLRSPRDDLARAHAHERLRRRRMRDTTSDLIAWARELDARVMGGDPSQIGPHERAAMRHTLLLIGSTLEGRLVGSGLNDDGLPAAEGFQWQAGSPMAGDLADISPFGNRDLWLTIPTPQRGRPEQQRPDPTDDPRRPLDDEVSDTGTEGQREGAWLGEFIAPEAPQDDTSGAWSQGLSSGADILAELFGHILRDMGGGLLGVVSAVGQLIQYIFTVEAVHADVRAAATKRGAQLGVVALDLMANDSQIPDTVSRRSLEARIHADAALEREWQSTIVSFSLEQGLQERALRQGVEIVANYATGVLALVRRKVTEWEADRGPVTEWQRQELRRRALRELTAAARRESWDIENRHRRQQGLSPREHPEAEVR